MQTSAEVAEHVLAIRTWCGIGDVPMPIAAADSVHSRTVKWGRSSQDLVRYALRQPSPTPLSLPLAAEPLPELVNCYRLNSVPVRTQITVAESAQTWTHLILEHYRDALNHCVHPHVRALLVHVASAFSGEDEEEEEEEEVARAEAMRQLYSFLAWWTRVSLIDTILDLGERTLTGPWPLKHFTVGEDLRFHPTLTLRPWLRRREKRPVWWYVTNALAWQARPGATAYYIDRGVATRCIGADACWLGQCHLRRTLHSSMVDFLETYLLESPRFEQRSGCLHSPHLRLARRPRFEDEVRERVLPAVAAAGNGGNHVITLFVERTLDLDLSLHEEDEEEEEEVDVVSHVTVLVKPGQVQIFQFDTYLNVVSLARKRTLAGHLAALRVHERWVRAMHESAHHGQTRSVEQLNAGSLTLGDMNYFHAITTALFRDVLLQH